MQTHKKLSKGQRSQLGRMAKDAWQKHHSAGATVETETEWRHREAIAACKHRISEAPAKCYDRLYGHFLMLQGQSGKAFDHFMGETNEVRRQRHKIATLAEELNLPQDYAAGRPAKQLKGIIINLEARARAVRQLAKVQEA